MFKNRNKKVKNLFIIEPKSDKIVISDMSYKDSIYLLRQKMCITQVELAQLLNVGVASVSRWEQGHYEPTMKVKRKLKALLKEAGIEE